MTADQLRTLIEELGLTQGQMARICAANPRTLRRWLDGSWPVPEIVARYLGELWQSGRLADVAAKSKDVAA